MFHVYQLVQSGGARAGGGRLNRCDSSPTINNSQFVTNHAAIHGGAMCNDYEASPQVFDSWFQQNTSNGDGGAIANFNKCSPTIELCEFIDNQAISGDAISNRFGVTAQVTQCEYTAKTDTLVPSEE